MALRDWNPNTDYVNQYSPGHARNNLMDLDLEGHLNRDHGYRLTSLMSVDYGVKQQLHDMEHNLMDAERAKNCCPNCGFEMST